MLHGFISVAKRDFEVAPHLLRFLRYSVSSYAGASCSRSRSLGGQFGANIYINIDNVNARVASNVAAQDSGISFIVHEEFQEPDKFFKATTAINADGVGVFIGAFEPLGFDAIDHEPALAGEGENVSFPYFAASTVGGVQLFRGGIFFQFFEFLGKICDESLARGFFFDQRFEMGAGLLGDIPPLVEEDVGEEKDQNGGASYEGLFPATELFEIHGLGFTLRR